MSAEQIPATYDRSLTSKRADLDRLGACWREYLSHFSPRAVLAAIAVALAARIYVGQWSWRDLVPVIALLAAQPFVEWVIHKYLLHLPPFEFRGRTVELYGSIQHRNHHLSPSDLDRVLLEAGRGRELHRADRDRDRGAHARRRAAARHGRSSRSR